eukprot:gene14692-biopygen15691
MHAVDRVDPAIPEGDPSPLGPRRQCRPCPGPAAQRLSMVLRLWRVRHGCLRHPCGTEGAVFGAEGATICAFGTEPHERKRCAACAARTRRSA